MTRSYSHGLSEAPLLGVTGKVQKFKLRDESIPRLGLEAAAAVISA